MSTNNEYSNCMYILRSSPPQEIINNQLHPKSTTLECS
uniref:Uncharacterized protein n=1 Tax=Rhizophora mucronata TaxID=61149 RepID=A0A2P2LWS0_RHIMU